MPYVLELTSEIRLIRDKQQAAPTIVGLSVGERRAVRDATPQNAMPIAFVGRQPAGIPTAGVRQAARDLSYTLDMLEHWLRHADA